MVDVKASPITADVFADTVKDVVYTPRGAMLPVLVEPNVEGRLKLAVPPVSEFIPSVKVEFVQNG